MKYSSLLLTIILLSAFFRAQEESTKSVDKLTIGMTLEDIRNEYPNAILRKVDGWTYNVDGGGFGTEILINDEIHFFVYSVNESPEIASISILSNKYEVNGVHVGMTMSALLSIYPSSTLS